MSIEACAGLLEKGDPDRFRAVMAAPANARGPLFAIFAFNLEVARAPWVSSEAAIGEMRLHWWADALEEIAQGGPVRRHEVLRPLADAIDRDGALLLADLVDARRRDLYADRFADAADLNRYLMRTSGTLMWVAARAIGCAQAEPDIRSYGQAVGLANWFVAVPVLRARGRVPLPDDSLREIQRVAEAGLHQLKEARRAIPRAARPATRSGWQAGRLLKSAAANPTAVIDGSLHIPEFSKRLSLIWTVLSGAP